MTEKNHLKKKKSAKTPNEKCCGNFADLGHEIMELVNHAKEKYDGMDEKKKKALVAGAAGAIALIAGAIGYKKARKK